MRGIQLAGVLVVLLTCLGCSHQQSIDIHQFTEKSELELQDEKYVLVVPQHGCSNCVKKSYDFILKHYRNEQIKYVFTHYSSKKAVRIRFKILGIEDASELSFIDLGSALELGLSQMYPSLIRLEHAGEASVTFMNAEDGSDWKSLEEDILN